MLGGWREVFLAGVSVVFCSSQGWADVPSSANAAKVAARQYDYAVTTTDCVSPKGRPTSATISLEGRRGWHLNGKAPIEIRFVPQSAVELSKLRLGRVDATVQSRDLVEFTVAIIPRQPGSNVVRGEVRFVICQPQHCKSVVEPIRIDVSAPDPGREGDDRPAPK